MLTKGEFLKLAAGVRLDQSQRSSLNMRRNNAADFDGN
jgi:hypothetical protein